jgi:hypothetical protein
MSSMSLKRKASTSLRLPVVLCMNHLLFGVLFAVYYLASNSSFDLVCNLASYLAYCLKRKANTSFRRPVVLCINHLPVHNYVSDIWRAIARMLFVVVLCINHLPVYSCVGTIWRAIMLVVVKRGITLQRSKHVNAFAFHTGLLSYRTT